MNKNLVKIIQEYSSYKHVFEDELLDKIQQLKSSLYYYNNHVVVNTYKVLYKFTIKKKRTGCWFITLKRK